MEILFLFLLCVVVVGMSYTLCIHLGDSQWFTLVIAVCMLYILLVNLTSL